MHDAAATATAAKRAATRKCGTKNRARFSFISPPAARDGLFMSLLLYLSNARDFYIYIAHTHIMQHSSNGRREDTCIRQAVDTHLCAPWGTLRGRAPLLLYAALQPTKWHAWPLHARTHLLFGIITTILQFASSYDKYFQCRNPIIRFCAWLRASIYKHNATIEHIHTTLCRFCSFCMHHCWCLLLFSCIGCFRFLRHMQTQKVDC
jgi:hypothetical protein